jgi:hypothetical protein
VEVPEKALSYEIILQTNETDHETFGTRHTQVVDS